MGIPDAVKIRFTSPVVNFFLWGWLFASGKQSTPNTQDRQRPGPRANLWQEGKCKARTQNAFLRMGFPYSLGQWSLVRISICWFTGIKGRILIRWQLSVQSFRISLKCKPELLFNGLKSFSDSPPPQSTIRGPHHQPCYLATPCSLAGASQNST